MTKIRSNGVDIEYESFGRDDAPVVLLIAGVMEQLTGWPDSLCEGLAAKGFRVIRFDNRDVGKSSHLAALGIPVIPELVAKLMSGQQPEPPYTLRDMAGDAVGLLDALGVARAHIVGRSMGGMIAQLVAIDFPEKTKSLVSIMSGSGRRGLPPSQPQAMAALTARPRDASREARIALMTNFFRTVGGTAFRPDDTELAAYVARPIDRVAFDLPGAMRHMAAFVTAPPRNDALKGVRAPTLVIHGADDTLVPPACGEDVAACVPGAQLLLVPGMGHDFSEAVVEKIYLTRLADFLTKVETQGAAPI